MLTQIYTPLQVREVFHLEFLRWVSRKLDAATYCLKGGINLRVFFHSIRYSEDMDLDVLGVSIERIQKAVMGVLAAPGFSDDLKSFGIAHIVPPNITTAKQTDTTQRFKIHLVTATGEDLFTQIECSRRGRKGVVVVEPVSASVLRAYKMAPLLVPHYDVVSAVQQKIHALAQRSLVQARDIFDLFTLSSQYVGSPRPSIHVNRAILNAAHDHIFLVEFLQFRDTVVAYLGADDQATYASPAVWDDIQLNTARFLEELTHARA
jgi:predicted nucleotidyltransferase component of viral defense system